MKRTIAFLSYFLVFTAVAFAQASQPQQKPEKLSKQQLNSLIETAKTPADHSRIAQYYKAEAQDYLAQSNQHEQMAAEYKKNPATSSAKFSTGTVNHCEYQAQRLKEKAVKLEELAQVHEQLALNGLETPSNQMGPRCQMSKQGAGKCGGDKCSSKNCGNKCCDKSNGGKCCHDGCGDKCCGKDCGEKCNHNSSGKICCDSGSPQGATQPGNGA